LKRISKTKLSKPIKQAKFSPIPIKRNSNQRCRYYTCYDSSIEEIRRKAEKEVEAIYPFFRG
jgi:hypothetical protein